MTTDLQLSGPTVTVFGDRDVLDAALSQELDRRGCSTHTVTIPTGWLNSASHAIVRVDSRAGTRAIEDLARIDGPAAHVVVVAETSGDDRSTTHLQRLCHDCGEHHHVSVIWHAPLVDPTEAVSAPEPGALATAIVDEIGHQPVWTSAPSFASRTFEPARHRGPA